MRLTSEEVLREYGDRLFRTALSVCRDPDDAEDAVQDTLIRYYRRETEFESETHLKAWLLRVTINRAKDLASAFWRRNRVGLEDYMETIPFEAPEDSRLLEAVLGLPQRYRLVIHLYYYEDYSVGEIAALLGSRDNTVKSWLYRGRQLLKQKLQEEWDDE